MVSKNRKCVIVPIIITLMVLSYACDAGAQQFNQQMTISASPNQVGSGARAMGMGGAFIAVADDATAASWNPGGLSQLKRPEISIVFSQFSQREDYTSDSHRESEGLQKNITQDLNYFSVAYPFELFERNMVISINYQNLYMFDREIDFSFDTRDIDSRTGNYIDFNQDVDFQQRGSLKALSPAFAIDITPEFSLGLTCNIWTDDLFWSNGWETDSHIKGTIAWAGSFPEHFEVSLRERYYDVKGYNFHFGFLWKLHEKITFGGVVKTPFTAQVKYSRRRKSTNLLNNGTAIHNTFNWKENLDLEMPLSYGIGVAVRFTDRITFSLDVYHTEWSKYVLETADGRRVSPVTGDSTRDSHVKDTTQIRMGLEYLFITTKYIIPLRCGLFYDPEPSRNNPEDYFGFSVGTGFAFGNVVIDAAYQCRIGNNVEGEVLSIPQTDADVIQNHILISMIYHF